MSKPKKNNNQKNKLFLITGTSRGLGKALQDLVSGDEKNDLIIINRKKTTVAKKNLKEIILNLSKQLSPTELQSLIGKLTSNKYNYVYIINNAATIKPIKKIGKSDAIELAESVTINFLNYALITNELIKKTQWLKTKYKIINITSGAASSPHSSLTMYCSTKAALEMFTRCIFIEQQKNKFFKIVAFNPGVIDTDMQMTIRKSKKIALTDQKLFNQLHHKKKLLNPEHVAKQIIKVLNNDNYWEHPVININQVK